MLTVSPAVFVPTSPAIVNVVTVNVVPASTSVSLLKTPFAAVTFNTTSSFVDFVSAFATGASLIGFTVIFKVLVTVVVPSETVYVISGTAPLKSPAGVKV